jgi:nuclear pore complex protein Nup62
VLVHVCVCACMYVWMCVYVLWTYVCMNMCVCVYMYVCLHVCMYLCESVCLCMHVCMYYELCMYKYVTVKVICARLTFVHHWLSRQTAAGQAPRSNPEFNVQNRCVSHLNSHHWEIFLPQFLQFDVLQGSITTRLTCRILCVQFVMWSFVQEKKRQQNFTFYMK